MPTWKEFSRTQIDGFDLVVSERMDSRNHHGATEYKILVERNGELIHFERHPWNVWLGHCYGQLLLPEVAGRAARILEKRDQ
jgi:hypothetical protein